MITRHEKSARLSRVVVALLVMTLTSLMDLMERRLLEWSRGSTDVPG